jgi:hypothetical protein
LNYYNAEAQRTLRTAKKGIQIISAQLCVLCASALIFQYCSSPIVSTLVDR